MLVFRYRLKCANPECHSLHRDDALLINVYFQQPHSDPSESAHRAGCIDISLSSFIGTDWSPLLLVPVKDIRQGVGSAMLTKDKLLQ